MTKLVFNFKYKTMTEKTIKKLEFASKILLIIYILWFLYFSFFDYEQKFYCFGTQIDLFVLISPIVAAVIIEIIVISILIRRNLPIKNSIQSFSKFLIISLLFSFFVAVIFYSPGSARKKAVDARKMSDLVQLYRAQEKFFKDKSRYTASLEELEQTGYIQEITEEAKRYNIIFEAGANLTTWTAQADIRQYEHEICSLKKGKKIYFCNEKGCKVETVVK